jgi:hypothetical protein
MVQKAKKNIFFRDYADDAVCFIYTNDASRIIRSQCFYRNPKISDRDQKFWIAISNPSFKLFSLNLYLKRYRKTPLFVTAFDLKIIFTF